MGVGLQDLLERVVSEDGSDLLVLAETVPAIRVDGELAPCSGLAPISSEALVAMMAEVLSPEQIARWRGEKELDFALSLEKRARFRANLYFQQGLPALALRRIPFVIPKPEEIGLPQDILYPLSDKPHGLVLVTGPTGSGKSTTLATMIDYVNRGRRVHIITIEDPIEYIHVPRLATISQREIGSDTDSFNRGLKYVLRQNPNIVLIGEMRDWETIQSAITVAETGHLVFATLHTNSTVQTIDRIIDVFPASQQNQVRTQLSFILEGVIAQRLVKKEGGGRTPALEILIPNTAVRNLIREGKTHQIYAQMQMGQGQSGMQTLAQALARLVADGVISQAEAEAHSLDHEDLAQWLNRYRRASAPKGARGT